MDQQMQQYLQSTYFLDYDTESVSNYAIQHAGLGTAKERAIRLYYAVRDNVRYNPYDINFTKIGMRASSILKRGAGFCVAKAVLLAAVGRQQGIPSRLGFADVTNHLSTEKLRQKMGTDLFVYHGYTEFFLDDKWVKATPAFNLTLCTKFNVRPLEFDGSHDSIFHEFDMLGNRHMDYVHDYGSFDDLPFEQIHKTYLEIYPSFLHENEGDTAEDFANDAARETSSS
jgi:transglutaminase-like putative cysteine protease